MFTAVIIGSGVMKFFSFIFPSILKTLLQYMYNAFIIKLILLKNIKNLFKKLEISKVVANCMTSEIF